MGHIPEYWFMEKSFDPASIAKFANQNSMWYESPEEVAAGLKEGRRRERALDAVRRAIPKCLTARQQLCIKEHCFEGKSYRRIGREQGLHFTTVAQHVSAAVRRLRKALCKQPI